MNPLLLFEKWFSEEKELSNLKLPAACCLSTSGLDGYPNSRFVSLKEIKKESFVITGPLDSRKGREIENHSKAALSFWWTSTERQIRIQGDVSVIPKSEAEIYFKQRNRDSKIVSAIFEQGQEILDISYMQKLFKEKKAALGNKEVEQPNSWGGIYIKPIRIEFMEFKKSRLHERKLFEQASSGWKMTIIQP
ncbi:pyridoxine/pyridoxamine 5'-phosphate oxidase [Aequorivita antarctica]|uniref:Pyridoxamine 5'-phosphate oxidase n=1 Tax=Aequorivita antarctica TaxID=153266 RepID=A0A5C6YZY1_9FLAO|nr:pyridoxal 5'-phosphate synthase [Aequorivita antarctica]TXD73333.1 pyridoxamine 5'-phosphate oxidase [Aequorivita antarctica]SRX76446.1 Pyridoxine/pyridoxamine 5'-phosphate oxidase [Aequorivita antarctica]